MCISLQAARWDVWYSRQNKHLSGRLSGFPRLRTSKMEELMTIEFTAIPTSVARSYQAGGVDAYGNLPEQSISSGPGCPCRHCLKNIPQGNEMLVLAHRPFPELQPYAETGPIFLCAAKCQRGGGSEALPEVLQADHYILRGYGPMTGSFMALVR